MHLPLALQRRWEVIWVKEGEYDFEQVEQNGESESGGSNDGYAKMTSLGIKKFGCSKGSHLGIVDAVEKSIWNPIMESLEYQMKGIGLFYAQRESLKAFEYGSKD